MKFLTFYHHLYGAVVGQLHCFDEQVIDFFQGFSAAFIFTVCFSTFMFLEPAQNLLASCKC